MKSKAEYQKRKDDSFRNGAVVANSLREHPADEYFPVLNIRECAKQWRKMKKRKHFYKKHTYSRMVRQLDRTKKHGVIVNGKRIRKGELSE